MQIVNPNGLEEGACECYRLMEAEMEKIFKQPWVKKTEFRADIPGNPPRR